jgi:hypothetical protein
MPARSAKPPATHNMSAKKCTIWATNCRHAAVRCGDGSTLGPSRANRRRASASLSPTAANVAARDITADLGAMARYGLAL